MIGLDDHEERAFFGFPWFPVCLRDVGVVFQGVAWFDDKGIDAVGYECFCEVVATRDELGDWEW